MDCFIYPWHEKSKGARALSSALGIKRILHTNSKFKGGPTKTVINWGASELPTAVSYSSVINKKTNVGIAAHKTKFFRRIKGKARIPDFTEDSTEALAWVQEGRIVMGRLKTKGKSGDGIIFIDDDFDKWLDAPLFTTYIKKKEEYRVHFAFGEQIDIQRKTLRKTDMEGNPIDTSQVDFRIRSYNNGFIFQRENIDPPKDVLVQAKLAFDASNLDFGAVDVIFNEKSGMAYVLEINTAPGLEGATIGSYAKAFKKHLNL